MKYKQWGILGLMGLGVALSLFGHTPALGVAAGHLHATVVRFGPPIEG